MSEGQVVTSADGQAAELQEGDIIFTSAPFYLFRKVAEATGSRASHVGILFKDGQGYWVVAESRVPLSQYTRLNRFLKRSDGWFAVRRLRNGLNEEQIERLRQACENQMGRVYHFGFEYESQRTFCSKFVYDAFRNALGVEIGTMTTFEQLLRQTPDAPLSFWKTWFFGRIPWGRKTVTPASQLISPQLQPVLHA